MTRPVDHNNPLLLEAANLLGIELWELVERLEADNRRRDRIKTWHR